MHVQPTTSTPPRSRSSRSASRVPRRSHPQHRASSAGRARRRRIDCGRRGEFGRWCRRDHRSARPRCDGPMGLTDSEIAVVDGRDETGLRAGCALTGPHGEPLHPGRNGLVRAADAATHALLPGCRAARLRTRCSGAGLTTMVCPSTAEAAVGGRRRRGLERRDSGLHLGARAGKPKSLSRVGRQRARAKLDQ